MACQVPCGSSSFWLLVQGADVGFGACDTEASQRTAARQRRSLPRAASFLGGHRSQPVAASHVVAALAGWALWSRGRSRRRDSRGYALRAQLKDFEAWAQDVRFHPDLKADIIGRFFNVPQQAEEAINYIVGRIERVARKCISPTAVVKPFGSTVNGFGAVSSDLDVLVEVDHEELSNYMSYVAWSRLDTSTREDGPAAAAPQLQTIGKKAALACAVYQLTDFLPKLGFEVKRSLPRIRRPLVTCVDKKVGETECDISVNNRLPLENTQLLRSYAKLDVRLRPFVIMIKTWAKNRRVCGADQGNLSSYAWTIMTIYFFQLAAGLPSLQMLKREESAIEDIDFWGYAQTFDNSYLPADVYLAENGGPLGTVGGDAEAVSDDPGVVTLLYGFFHFFSQEYRWGDEVVSMRCPDRRHPDLWWLLYGRAQAEPTIHVEDPIELRDLNIVMKRERLAVLKEELKLAALRLREGASLEELLEVAPAAPSQSMRKRHPFAPAGPRALRNVR